MNDDATVPDRVHRIVIDLAPGAEPIAGTVLAPPEPPRPFLGWLALISAIDDARTRTPAGSELTSSPPREGLGGDGVLQR